MGLTRIVIYEPGIATELEMRNIRSRIDENKGKI
jgi:hypothetical protein